MKTIVLAKLNFNNEYDAALKELQSFDLMRSFKITPRSCDV